MDALEVLGPRWAAGIDYLALTMSADDARRIVERWEEVERVGGPKHGFGRTEQRPVMGGMAWRRFDPVTPSKRHGLNYESWEWDGSHANSAAEEWCGVGHSTRADIASDFECQEDMTAVDLLNRLRPWIESAGLTIGMSGDEPHLTCYVGGRQSEFRIRIYRKDVQQDAKFGGLWSARGYPAVMRVELMLRGRRADEFWQVYARSRDAAFKMAAGQVLKMCGLRVAEATSSWCELVESDAFCHQQQSFQWFRQNGAAAAGLVDGLGVAAFVELIEEARATSSRETQWRSGRRASALRLVAPQVVDFVRVCLASRSPAVG